MTQPRAGEGVPGWLRALQDEEHPPDTSRSLSSIRPRRQIPEGRQHRSASLGCPPSLFPSPFGVRGERDPPATHGGRWVWGSSGRRAGRSWPGPPAAGSRAGSCSAPPSPPTSRCRAPASGSRPRAARSSLGTGKIPQVGRGLPEGGSALKRTAPKPGRRRTSAEGFVAQPAAAAGPARAPLQLLVLPLAAPQADGRCAGPVGVLGRWQRGGEGHSGVRGAEEHPAPQPHSPQGAGVSPKAPKFSFQPARPSPVPNFSAGPRRGARSLLVPAAPGCFASPPPRSQTPRCYLLGTRRSPAWPAGRGRGAPAP